jgi:diguanylate cyclase (GGDEF)-like protein
VGVEVDASARQRRDYRVDFLTQCETSICYTRAVETTGDATIPVRRLTLSFEPTLERDFRVHYRESNQRYLIHAILVAIVVFGGFGFLDRALLPDGYRRLWQIRYLYTMPFLVIPLVLAMIPAFVKHNQIFTFVAALGTGAGVIMIITEAGDQLGPLYYASILLVFMVVHGFSRLRFPLAIVVSATLIALYQISATVVAPIPASVLLINSGFLVAGFTIGIAISYSFEYSVRRSFYLNQLLHREQGKLEGMYRDLESQVRQRTGQLRNANEELERLALFDPLTGLHNRRSMEMHLKDALMAAKRERTPGFMALLYIDLDFFKDANDIYGHDMGDEILRLVAQRIDGTIRESDYSCRLGGDELIVFLQRIKNDIDAGLVAEKLLDRLSEPYVITGHEIVIGASIGISVFPRDGTSVQELVKNADDALRAAKKQRGTYLFYSESLHKRATERITLIGELRAAIVKEEFFLLYQPIVDGSGAPVVAEALLRWRSPSRGIVSPMDFIPVLEDTGLITQVGRWILKQACADARKWIDGGAQTKVAVNVSPLQFKDDGFEASVAEALDSTGLQGEFLELEITEGLFLEDVQATVQKLESIRGLGISFAVDDFGTGYSSLRYIRNLPVSTIKIDATFVGELPSSSPDAAIIRSVVSMSDGLALRTVAEGVETEEQFDFLRDNGCKTFQGYYFTKPIDADALAVWSKGR